MDEVQASRPESGNDANAALATTSEAVAGLKQALSTAHKALDVSSLLIALGPTQSRSDLQMALVEAWDRGAEAGLDTNRPRHRRHL